jgi:hypothetical protein
LPLFERQWNENGRPYRSAEADHDRWRKSIIWIYCNFDKEIGNSPKKTDKEKQKPTAT